MVKAMPTYEMVFLVKKMERPALKALLKRCIENIWESGGTVRNLENLGLMKTPYTIRSKGKKSNEAHYFLLNYNVSFSEELILRKKFYQDKEIIQGRSFLENKSPGEATAEEQIPECTLYLDLLPPAYRPSVLELQKYKTKDDKMRERLKFKYNTGLDYDAVKP